MNKEKIELLKNEIEFLEMKMKEAEELDNSLYRNGFKDIRNFFKQDYEFRPIIDKLEKQLELYQMLTEKGIDTNEEYYLYDDIYLSIKDLKPYFNIENGSWIYDNYINSWSGMNEWINDLIDRNYSLFSGNSPYCHAFNTMSMSEIFSYIENEEKPNETKLALIENIVEFTKENGKFKDIHDKVVKSIKFKLDMMKENIEKDDFEY